MDAPRGFLKPLSFLSRGRKEEAKPEPKGPIRKRRNKRYNITGATMQVVVDSTQYALHVKDISACGLCGLTDAPLAPNQVVCLYLARTEPAMIQIRWIRRTLIGAAFMQDLPEDTMQRLLKVHQRIG